MVYAKIYQKEKTIRKEAARRGKEEKRGKKQREKKREEGRADRRRGSGRAVERGGSRGGEDWGAGVYVTFQHFATSGGIFNILRGRIFTFLYKSLHLSPSIQNFSLDNRIVKSFFLTVDK